VGVFQCFCFEIKEKVEERRVQKWANSIPFMGSIKKGPCGAFASFFFELTDSKPASSQRKQSFPTVKIFHFYQANQTVYINEERKPLSSFFAHASLSGFSKSSLS